MDFLVIEGTVREGRKSIHAARHVTKLLNRENEAELFDPAEKEIPYLGNRRYKEEETPTPEAVEEFGEKVEQADGIVIVSPEYNHSYPGMLKNLLDYLYPEYDGKPFSYVTVSAGGFGGVRALDDLQSLTLALGGIPGPSMQVSRVGDVFSEDGELVDDDQVERFQQFADKVIEHA